MSYAPSHRGASIANRRMMEALATRGHRCTAIAVPPDQEAPTDGAEAEGAAKGSGGRPGAASREARGDAGPSALPDAELHAGVSVHTVTRGRPLRDAVTTFVRDHAPDLVLVSADDPIQELVRLATTLHPRVVLLVHTTMNLPFGPFAFATNASATKHLQQVSGVVTVSEYLRAYVGEHGGLDATVLRFPVYGDPPFLDVRSTAAADDGFVLTINPCAVKGIDLFLRLADRFPKTPFAGVPTWGTTDDDRARMERRANVSILDPVDDIDALFRRTRVLLVPSLWDEAFGLVAVEAMLRGIPVMASDVGGLSEAKLDVPYSLPVRPIEGYTPHSDGRDVPTPVVPEQDVAPWQTALARLLDDPDHHRRVADASRQAALAFVGGVGPRPFERYFEACLTGAAPDAAPSPHASQPDEDQRRALRERLANLSPEKRAALERKLRSAKRDNAPH